MGWWTKRRTPESQALVALHEVAETEISIVMREIESKLAEISFRLKQEDRLIPWLFLSITAAVGLIAADQLPIAVDVLTEHPLLFMVGAVLLLWFPILSAIAWSDIAACAAYIRTQAQPRLGRPLAARRAALVGLGLDELMARLPALDERNGLMGWEDFREEFLFKGRLAWRIMPLWILRSSLLYVPTAGAVAGYVILMTSQDRWSQIDVWDIGVVATWLAIVVVVLVAFASRVSNLKVAHSTTDLAHIKTNQDRP